MSHARQQIREAVVTVLQAFPVLATVQDTRIWIVQQAELPLVGVYTSTEAITFDEGATMGETDALMRELEVVLDIAVSSSSGQASMNALDDLAAECEEALGVDRNMLGIMDITPAAVDVEQSTEGDSVISRMQFGFICLYRTAVGFPQVII